MDRGPRPRAVVGLLLALAAAPSGAQQAQPVPTVAARGPAKIEAIPDPVRPALAEVPYVNPLFRPVASPAALVELPKPENFESPAALLLAVHLDETGRVLEVLPVEPPLKGLAASLPSLTPKWKFTPAKKEGRAVATWATYGIDLDIELDKGSLTLFNISPVGKDDPIPHLMKEYPGDTWIRRYPREIEPKDPAALSVEDVDFLPVPQKAKWSYDSTRLKSKVSALVEVSASGSARRILPVGSSAEPLVMAWLRKQAMKWRFTPALRDGKAVDSWMALDATLEYELDSAKERGKRSLQKNLRGTPAD